VLVRHGIRVVDAFNPHECFVCRDYRVGCPVGAQEAGWTFRRMKMVTSCIRFQPNISSAEGFTPYSFSINRASVSRSCGFRPRSSNSVCPGCTSAIGRPLRPATNPQMVSSGENRTGSFQARSKNACAPLTLPSKGQGRNRGSELSISYCCNAAYDFLVFSSTGSACTRTACSRCADSKLWYISPDSRLVC
jgi:hypothetical protein